MTLRSLRAQILFVPGELIRTGTKPTLKFLPNYWHRDVIEYALRQIDKLKI
jgi:hypothetical protein